MSFTLDANILTAAFESAGFDVTCGDAVIARREQDAVWEVAIDNSGRLKATVAYMTEPAHETTAPALDREALVLVERSATITVLFDLQDPAELRDALTAIETIVAQQIKPATDDWQLDDWEQ